MQPIDLIDRLNNCFDQLQCGLNEMNDLMLSLKPTVARVFVLPEVDKGEEHQHISKIEVTQLVGQKARVTGLAHYKRMFIYDQKQNTSSKSAIRLPGALCWTVDNAQYQAALEIITRINCLKTELMKLITVESALPPEQRFDFVHQHLRGLKTLSAYRSLQVITDPDTVRFGWANKQIIKNLTRQEVLAMLGKSLEAKRTVPPYSRAQWNEKLREEINAVSKLPPDIKLKIRRPVKVQPIARVWYQQQQKQIQYACPSPLLVLCRGNATTAVPIVGELLNYDSDNIAHRHKPKSQPTRLLLPRLHLYVADE
ncbi:DNA replication terminus site-binding protein [Biostraticola tofi]|uniref:DNA replication terminus site-binding protein n=1 Tax=Biostraticola tofi TaxID=466109 RepID=A0A4R3Z6X3_9GAMM|nr:DNA replication terminus site-binding protein [Biostraticola tofi]TCV99789.1 DNA replication terminus site binding protein [Biostraticola tofi]